MAATAEGFELRRLSELSSTGAPTEYSLQVEQLDGGAVAVRITAAADGLLSAELELSYPAERFALLEGAYGDWPQAAGEVEQAADFQEAGTVGYEAQALSTAGADGRFDLLQLKFEQLEQPESADPLVAHAAGAETGASAAALSGTASANSWPSDKGELSWLDAYYLALPRLDDRYSVYGDAEWSRRADRIFELANAERIAKKHTPLKRDAHLDAIAQAQAIHMAEADFFDHINPQGMDVFDRIDAVDSPRWTTSGENISAGYRTAAEAHKGWMDSGGHRKNIRNENYRYMGVGVYHDPDTEMGWFWVQVFATFDADPAGHDWIDPQERR